MNQESSNDLRSVVPDKFSPRRKVMFPRDFFIELRLSKRQVLKVRGWEKEGHSVMPMWFTSCERVLFLDQERFEEWILRPGILRKGKR